jgi:glycosyltransferase involved in cell wall biosynthesis
VSKRSTIAVARWGARLSRLLPDKVVCCAETARTVHVAIGYAPGHMVVIPNGFDLEIFHPSHEARQSLRSELGLGGDTLLVALPARFDPQKDHHGFLTAAGIVHRNHPAVHYILCGDGTDGGNGELTGWIAEHCLTAVCHRLGPRADMARIMSGSDIVVSASAFGEGFSNVLGEAMAAGTPCVATDVGDSHLIVGDAGRIVPARDPGALAAALTSLIELNAEDRRALGQKARAHIAQHYEIGTIAARFLALYRETLAAKS